MLTALFQVSILFGVLALLKWMQGKCFTSISEVYEMTLEQELTLQSLPGGPEYGENDLCISSDSIQFEMKNKNMQIEYKIGPDDIEQISCRVTKPAKVAVITITFQKDVVVLWESSDEKKQEHLSVFDRDIVAHKILEICRKKIARVYDGVYQVSVIG